ncbi:DUF6055 domain-containing protein [Xanthomonas sp. 4461]|uniref:DUF6055 domain-containing protein n=1 Tax=Xanthomonas sp. 4461 TaxID=3035313 RepID=UPI00216761C2|nr:DUF6055 domain-containing protein [Xanthomonas sp. 4461]MCS3807186.1 hypothetical protein [Xanthomonas sp. 4461]
MAAGACWISSCAGCSRHRRRSGIAHRPPYRSHSRQRDRTRVSRSAGPVQAASAASFQRPPFRRVPLENLMQHRTRGIVRAILATVLSAALPGIAAAAEAVGCQSLSNDAPWGAAQPLRTWTPVRSSAALNAVGAADGAPFQARLITAFGEDSAVSVRSVVLEYPDGCRRRYQLLSFAASDRQYVATVAKAHPARVDRRTYLTKAEPDTITAAMLANGSAKKYETQHFAFWYGANTAAESYRDVATRGVAWTTFVTRSAAWFEKVWQMNADLLGAPMPYAAATAPKRINVYLCGTGLPYVQGGDLTECGASGGQAIGISSWALGYGSHSVAHEFMHTLQYYSGGYRNLPAAGWFWETHANWSAFQTARMDDSAVAYYQSNLENGPLFPESRYGAHPLLMFLAETDATRSLVWEMWLKNQRNAAGDTLELPIQTVVRLGQQQGVFPQGFRSFADSIGRYGARLAAFDFVSQKALLDISKDRAAAKRYVPLKALATRGRYASSPERPLNIYGTHVIPLTPQTGAKAISVSLQGKTVADQAAWRFTLVSLDAQSHPTYAPLGAVDGTAKSAVTLTLPAGSTQTYLVVTATPYRYSVVPTAVEQLAGKRPLQFPYEVSITGATPLAGLATTCYAYAGTDGLDQNWNTNGHRTDDTPCR